MEDPGDLLNPDNLLFFGYFQGTITISPLIGVMFYTLFLISVFDIFHFYF